MLRGGCAPRVDPRAGTAETTRQSLACSRQRPSGGAPLRSEYAMFEWLLRLFDTSAFPPRWSCGEWTAGLGWTHIAADLAIWVAYLGIPAVILLFLRRRQDLALQPVC
jgi:hypothetical protein